MLVEDDHLMPLEDKAFFFLLRIGLWQKVEGPLFPFKGDQDKIDWSDIHRLACEQTVQGIVADGIGLCKTAHPEAQVDAQVYGDFLNQSAQIVRQNYKINQVQAKVCKLLTSPASIHHVILKGQGVAQSYPKPMLRCCGDIDLFFTPEDFERAKVLLKPLSTSVEDKPLSLECALVIDGVDVELHGAMTSGINNAADKHLQVILGKVLNEGDTRILSIFGNEVNLPSANFDAIYILIHTIRHLGAFGISLRQIIDWAIHMHANRDIIDRARLQHDIEAMHLQKLWSLFSNFAIEYLGAPREDFALDANGSRSIEQLQSVNQLSALWQIIRASGSFGHNNPYFEHLHAGRLNERYFRIHYHVKQALAMRQFDAEFSNFLLSKELKDTFKSPFRFLFGGQTKITE